VFDTVTDARSVRHAVWVLSAHPQPGVIPDAATHLPDSDPTAPFQVWELSPDAGTSDYLGFGLGSACTAA
jgi:hypothetical protein